MSSSTKTPRRSDGLLKFRNALRGAGSAEGIARALRFAPSDQFREAAAWLVANPGISQRALPPPLPESARELKCSKPWPTRGLALEIGWASSYLHRFADRLSEFAETAHRYGTAILGSDAHEARHALEEVKATYGESFWLLKRRIFLIQHLEGLESQKNFVATIRKEGIRNGFAAYIAHWVSIRNEPAVSFMHFERLLDEALRPMGADYRAYLEWHLNASRLTTPAGCADVLRHEATSSIIDYYETLVRVCRLVVALRHTQCYPAISNALENLSGVRDPRLDLLDWALRSSFSQLSAPVRLATTNGAPPLGTQFDELELESRSNAADATRAVTGSPEALRQRILSLMTSALRRTSNAVQDLADLRKLSLNCDGDEWAGGLLGFVEMESSAYDVPRVQAMIAELSVPRIHPNRLRYIEDTDRRDGYQRLIEDSTSSVSPPMNQSESVVLEARVAQFGAEATVLHSCAEHLRKLPNEYYRRQGAVLIAGALLRLGRIQEAAQEICSTLLDEPHLRHFLPMEALLARLDLPFRRNHPGEIAVPILFQIAAGNTISPNYALTAYACERYVNSWDVDLPSRIAVPVMGPLRQSTIYFLRHVCTEQILGLGTLFGSSGAVLSERLAICELLARVDAVNIDAYRPEIKDLVRRTTLLDRQREVEQSRVYVDLDGIRRVIRAALQDDFERYAALGREGLIGAIPDVNEAFGRWQAGDRQALTSLALPENEATEVLNRMLNTAEAEFLFNTEHGLDGYLSVRIRHGAMSSQLRGPLEQSNLVTQKDRATDKYKANEYWPEKVAKSPRTQKLVSDRLRHFSEIIDRTVKEFSAEWVQIYRKVHPNGMLLFGWSNSLRAVLSERLSGGVDLEEFIRLLLLALGAQLDSSLDALRARIEGEAKERVTALLTDLQADLERMLKGSLPGALVDRIGATRNEMGVSLDRIAAWFRQSASHSSDPFMLTDAIEMAHRNVKAVSREFQVSCSEEGSPIFVEGAALASIVDVFFILLENVLRHSELAEPGARITIDYRSDEIEIAVSNPVRHGVSGSEAEFRLATIRAAIDSGSYLTSVTTEGGTGLCKVAKILSRDLNVGRRLRFGYEGDEFVAVIRIAFVETTGPEGQRLSCLPPKDT